MSSDIELERRVSVNKEMMNQSLMSEYMLLQHKYSMLLKSLGYRHPTDDDVEVLKKMEHRLEVLREVFEKDGMK